MFDNPVGREDQVRAELAREVADVGQRISDLIDKHPVRNGPYPLPDVHGRLVDQFDRLRQVIDAFPLPIAQTEDGKPNLLGKPLATLMASLAYVTTLYRNLENFPDWGPARRDFVNLGRDALGVVAVSQPDDTDGGTW